MEVVAPAPGVIEAILVGEGETILSEALLATLVEGEAAVVRSEARPIATPALMQLRLLRRPCVG